MNIRSYNFSIQNQKYFNIAAIILFLSLLVLKNPIGFFHPNLVSDDLTVFYSYAIENPGIESIWNVHNRYLMLYVSFGSYVAANWFPYEYAAHIYNFFSIILYAVLAHLILTAKNLFLDNTSKLLALLAIAFSTQGTTFWLFSYSHFYLAIITLILLISGNPSNWRHNALLLLAGLSSPIALFLSPFFLWKALNNKQRNLWRPVFILFVSGIVQIFAYIQGTDLGALTWRQNEGYTVGHRFSRLEDLDLMILWFANLSLVNTFLGYFGISELGVSGFRQTGKFLLKIYSENSVYGWLILILSFSATVFIVKLMQGFERHQQRNLCNLLICCFLVSASISFITSFENREEMMFRWVRYLMVPSIIIVWCMIINMQNAKTSPQKWLYKLIVVWCLGYGFFGNYISFDSRGVYTTSLAGTEHKTSWKEEVEKWRADPSYTPNNPYGAIVLK